MKSLMNRVYIEQEVKIENENQLPYIDPLFIDRLFKMFSVEDIVTMYTALLFEQDRFLVVFQNQFDALPMMSALTSLMYPLKYHYPITTLIKKPDNFGQGEFQVNNSEMDNFASPMQIVMGISQEMYPYMKQNIIGEDIDLVNSTLVAMATDLYDQP